MNPQESTLLVSAGRSHSAVSVVNALPTGKGAAIGIGLKCEVRARLLPSGKFRVILAGKTRDDHDLVKTCVNHTLRFLGLKPPEGAAISLSIHSEIPPAVGLKSSSAVSVACVEATSKIFSASLDSRKILRISCNASIDCKASVTGAYDDAAACYLGGYVVTDNAKYRLLEHSRVVSSGKIVNIRIPENVKRFTSRVNLGVYAPFRKESLKAFALARKGLIREASMLNSLLQCSALGYSFEPVSSAIEEGARVAGISGKGPAIFAICKNEKSACRIERRWLEESTHKVKILRTQIVQAKESQFK